MSQAVVPRGPGCGKQVLALSPSHRALYDGRATPRESLEKEVISHPEKKSSLQFDHYVESIKERKGKKMTIVDVVEQGLGDSGGGIRQRNRPRAYSK